LGRDPFDPDTDVRNVPDLAGSGRTGNAPARVFTYTFALTDTARVTLGGRAARLADLRPDQFVRVVGRLATNRVDAPPDDRKLRLEQTGVGGTNTAASDARNVGMIAENIEAFTVPPPGFPPRRDQHGGPP
jgi:hypothetical protein